MATNAGSSLVTGEIAAVDMQFHDALVGKEMESIAPDRREYLCSS